MDVEARMLQIGYGDFVAVKELDIHIDKHQITTIIGPSGSVKSTLLKAITRLLKFQHGSVSIGGVDIMRFSAKELSRRISVLPQVHSAPADFRVNELVSYGRMPHQKMLSGLTKRDKGIVDNSMRVTGTYHLRNKSVFEISGGESQRVWIAMVLAQQPEILFLDEPATYLDIAHQFETMRLVRKLNRETGIGIVMVLHDLSHALEVSDRIIVWKMAENMGKARRKRS